MSGSEFIFDGINSLYYDLNKISLNGGGGSYLHTPDWIDYKKATINPRNDDDGDNKCSQHSLTITLNYQSIGKNPQRINKIKPLIDQYNWERIDFPTQSKDWKKFESNNKSIAVKVLYVPHNTKKICPAYISK